MSTLVGHFVLSHRKERREKNTAVHLIALGFNGILALVSHVVKSPREREKRDKRDSRGDWRERKMNESKETEEIKKHSLSTLYLLQR